MSLTKTQLFGVPSASAAAESDVEETYAPGSDSIHSPVIPGSVVAGKYRVEHALAMGGMGVVVAGRHVASGDRVAIKFLREDVLSDPETVARFEREARAGCKLKSEHATKVIDVGSLENGTPYMVMEYLEGEDLASWLRTRGALRLGQAVEFMLQACEAMSEVHALGFVHRDVKPANLFVSRRADGLMTIKILDFGITKIPSDRTLTRRNVAIGSPCYMSPEQITHAAEIDSRADIWALGVTLFEMLTGEVPFDGDSTGQLCRKILRDPPSAVRDLRPNVPLGLESVIEKCLQKDRENRFKNVGEFAAALAPFGSREARGRWRDGTDADGRLDATHVVWDQEGDAFVPKRRVRPGFVVFGALGLASFIMLLAWRAREQRAADRELPQPAERIAASVPSPPSDIPLPPPEADSPEMADAIPMKPALARENPPPPRKAPARAGAAPIRGAANLPDARALPAVTVASNPASTVAPPSPTAGSPVPHARAAANVFDERN